MTPEPLTESEDRLDDALAAVPETVADAALEMPVADRSLAVPWPIQSEYDAMAWGFRVAQLRARAAWAKEMARQIEREAKNEERRLIYAVGGRVWKEGTTQRIGYGQLEQWARDHLTRNRKSVKTPAGTFAFREAASSLQIPFGREAQLMEYARTFHPEWIKVVETLRVDEIKAAIEATGEVPVNERGEELVLYFKAARRDFFHFSPAAGAEALPDATVPTQRLQETEP